MPKGCPEVKAYCIIILPWPLLAHQVIGHPPPPNSLVYKHQTKGGKVQTLAFSEDGGSPPCSELPGGLCGRPPHPSPSPEGTPGRPPGPSDSSSSESCGRLPHSRSYLSTLPLCRPLFYKYIILFFLSFSFISFS